MRITGKMDKIDFTKVNQAKPIHKRSTNKTTKCDDCTGYETCPREMRGLKVNFRYEDYNGQQLKFIDGYEDCPIKWGNVKSFNVPLDQFSNLYTDKKEKVIKLFREEMKKPNPLGFYLCGDNSKGKTYFLYWLANETRKLGKDVTICTYIYMMNDIMEGMRDNTDGGVMYRSKKYSDADVLFIDDIGRGGISDFKVNDILFDIINTRVIRGLTTFFSSNFTTTELVKEINKGSKRGDDDFSGKTIKARIERLAYVVKVTKDEWVAKDFSGVK